MTWPGGKIFIKQSMIVVKWENNFDHFPSSGTNFDNGTCPAPPLGIFLFGEKSLLAVLVGRARYNLSQISTMHTIILEDNLIIFCSTNNNTVGDVYEPSGDCQDQAPSCWRNGWVG